MPLHNTGKAEIGNKKTDLLFQNDIQKYNHRVQERKSEFAYLAGCAVCTAVAVVASG